MMLSPGIEPGPQVYYELRKMSSSQLVGHCTGIAEVMGLIPIPSRLFSGFVFATENRKNLFFCNEIHVHVSELCSHDSIIVLKSTFVETYKLANCIYTNKTLFPKYHGPLIMIAPIP